MTMRHSNWEYPSPRSGWSGQWDRFVGPGASSAEQWVPFGVALLAALAVAVIGGVGDLEWNTVQWGLALVLAFDIAGGAATLATGSAKRWYHRPGQTARHHLGFIGVHVVHLALVAFVFRGGDVVWFVAMSAWLMLGAFAVSRSPIQIQRCVAVSMTCLGTILALSLFNPTPGLEWLVPVLFVKLLIGHATVEEPYESVR